MEALEIGEEWPWPCRVFAWIVQVVL